jgi:hypothetical protein
LENPTVYEEAAGTTKLKVASKKRYLDPLARSRALACMSAMAALTAHRKAPHAEAYGITV